jgi:hypothetical protein
MAVDNSILSLAIITVMVLVVTEILIESFLNVGSCRPNFMDRYVRNHADIWVNLLLNFLD